MSFASDKLAAAQAMLEKAQAAYARALDTPQFTQFNTRRTGEFDIKDLLSQVQYWQKQVDSWAAIANGAPSRAAPLRPYL